MAKKKVKKKVLKPLGDGPGFEQSLARLEEIAAEIETGSIGLEQSLKRYEEGVRLLRRCNAFLNHAQRRIELLSGYDAEGNPVTSPLADDKLSLEEKAQKRSRRRTANADADRDSPPQAPDCEENADDDSDIDDSGRLF